MNADRLVSSTDVKAFFGYSQKSSATFWQFIHSSGVPHIRLNSRRIMFDPQALNHWLAKHDTSTHPRTFQFTSDGRATFNEANDVPRIETNPIPKGRTLSNEDIEQIALRVSSLILAYLPSRVNRQLSSELADFIAGKAKRNVKRRSSPSSTS